MTTITSSSGTVYHLWSLPTGKIREITPGIEFNEIRNDLGNGYRAQVLYGSDTGVRSWSISIPTLGGNDFPVPLVTGVNGETVTQEQYLWDLYCETRITGKPFVFICPRDGQYYLVDFMNTKLTHQKTFRADLYSAGIELGQVREVGETIFQPYLYAFNRGTGHDFVFSETGHNAGLSRWYDGVQGSEYFGTSGVTLSANPQNGHNTARFSGAGTLTSTSGMDQDVCDLIIALKIREATFTGADTLLSGSIVATNAGTKWQNPALTGFEYRLNGLDYAVSDMQAPMNTWGVCHFRATEANPLPVGSFMSMGAGLTADIGEMYITASPLPMSGARLLTEFLVTKWRD